jgi:PadR family transcriptional regulator PadR
MGTTSTRSSSLLQGVLMAIADAPGHARAILDRMAQPSHRDARWQPAELYPALYQLERKGLVCGCWETRAGRRRTKYYAITDKGRRRLGAAERVWPRRPPDAASWGAVAVLLASPTASGPRVRSSHPQIARLVTDGSIRSATFRGLFRTIDNSDGLVYVEPCHCGHGFRSCLLLSVTRAALLRVLRILIELPRRPAPAGTDDLIASIGHELTHATEVLAHPTLTTPSAIYLFYLREAPTQESHFETAAAIETGNRIGRELAVPALPLSAAR